MHCLGRLARAGQRGAIEGETVAEAIKDLKIDPEKNISKAGGDLSNTPEFTRA